MIELYSFAVYHFSLTIKYNSKETNTRSNTIAIGTWGIIGKTLPRKGPRRTWVYITRNVFHKSKVKK